MRHTIVSAVVWFCSLVLFPWMFSPPLLMSASATELMNDPGGFHGIRWGGSLDQVPGLALVDPGEHVKGYEQKDGPARVGEAQVESAQFFTLDGKFARVAIHYRGRQTHQQVLSYLEQRFGEPDQQPGAMMRGLNQEYIWRGPQSQIILTYEDRRERGTLFFESRDLAPLFLENLGGG